MSLGGDSEGTSRRTSRYVGSEPRRSLFAERHRAAMARHADPGWYEWGLREFIRYWYVLGVLAVALFVPLQIEFSFGATDTSPGANPVLLGLAMLAAAAALIVGGVFGYLYLWKPQGWVDRAVERHEDAVREAARNQSGAGPPR